MPWELFVITQLSILLVGLVAVFVLHQRALKRQIVLLTEAFETGGGDLPEEGELADSETAKVTEVSASEGEVSEPQISEAPTDDVEKADEESSEVQANEEAVETQENAAETGEEASEEASEEEADKQNDIEASGGDQDSPPAQDQGGFSELLRQLTKDNREMIHRIGALEAENEELRKGQGDAAA